MDPIGLTDSLVHGLFRIGGTQPYFVTLGAMSAPFMPSPLDYVGVRRFALYPPLEQPDPNEWILGAASRSEVEVVNACTGRAIWIPRRHIGAVSETHDSVLLVGLTQVLNCNGANAKPRVKRVIEMPSARGLQERPVVNRSSHPAPVIGIRLESKSDSAFNKAMISAATGAVVIALLAALVAAAAKF
jgi:hypothetical protein